MILVKYTIQDSPQLAAKKSLVGNQSSFLSLRMEQTKGRGDLIDIEFFKGQGPWMSVVLSEAHENVGKHDRIRSHGMVLSVKTTHLPN